jgi:hypothetical protein
MAYTRIKTQKIMKEVSKDVMNDPVVAMVPPPPSCIQTVSSTPLLTALQHPPRHHHLEQSTRHETTLAKAPRLLALESPDKTDRLLEFVVYRKFVSKNWGFREDWMELVMMVTVNDNGNGVWGIGV